MFIRKGLKLSVIIPTLFICLLALCSQASAADVYMGNFRSGNQAWLVSESLKMHSMRDCDVTVKKVRNGKFLGYLQYSFSGGVTENGYVETFTCSDGRRGTINAQGLDEWSVVEHNIFSYFQKKWSDYVIGHK